MRTKEECIADIEKLEEQIHARVKEIETKSPKFIIDEVHNPDRLQQQGFAPKELPAYLLGALHPISYIQEMVAAHNNINARIPFNLDFGKYYMRELAWLTHAVDPSIHQAHVLNASQDTHLYADYARALTELRDNYHTIKWGDDYLDTSEKIPMNASSALVTLYLYLQDMGDKINHNEGTDINIGKPYFCMDTLGIRHCLFEVGVNHNTVTCDLAADYDGFSQMKFENQHGATRLQTGEQRPIKNRCMDILYDVLRLAQCSPTIIENLYGTMGGVPVATYGMNIPDYGDDVSITGGSTFEQIIAPTKQYADVNIDNADTGNKGDDIGDGNIGDDDECL